MKDMLEEKMGEGKDTCFMLRGGAGRGNLRIEGGGGEFKRGLPPWGNLC